MQARWAWFIVLAYAMVGLVLRAVGSINILPPCLWTAIFHRHCPGCGITTACVHLLRGQWSAAWQSNPLVFPAVILIIGAILADFFKFYRTFASAKRSNDT